MAYDGTDFEDTDYSNPRPANTGASLGRAPSREEIDAQLTGTQQQLAKLRETQDQLERARVSLEEMRRRRSEFANGRTEMLQSLTRGIGILEKAETDARRDAEQMAKSLAGLQEALTLVERLQEQSWNDATWEQELTRALTTIENARLEFNGARLKWPILDGKTPAELTQETEAGGAASLAQLPLGKLCKLGLALTWPIAVVALIALGVFLLLWFRR
jgi:chromosome segregation ATPase